MKKIRLLATTLLAVSAVTAMAAAPDFKSYVLPDYDPKSDTGTYPTIDTYLTGWMADNGVGIVNYVYSPEVTVVPNNDCKDAATLTRAGEKKPLAELTTAQSLGEFFGFDEVGIVYSTAEHFINLIFANYYSGIEGSIINQPGTYIVSIPAGYFLINGEACAPCEFDYHIGAGVYLPKNDVSIDLGYRNDYITDEGWSGIRFEPFEGSMLNTPIEGITEGCTGKVSVFNGEFELIATAEVSDIVTETVDGNTSYFIPFDKGINETGSYAVVLPEGLWRIGENEVKSLSIAETLNYTVTMSANVLITADNDEPRANLDNVVMAVNGIIDSVDETLTVGLRKNTSMDVIGKFNLTLTDNKRGFILTPEEAFDLTSGRYVIMIPAGLITIDFNGEKVTNKVANITYQIDTTLGVEFVIDSQKKVTVITPSGIILHRNADSSVITELENGLYIVNGRKVVIK